MKTKLTAQSAEIYAHRDLKMTVSEQELNIRILERDSAKMKKKFENTIQEIRSKYEECRKNLRSSDDELLKHKQLCEKQDEDLEDARRDVIATLGGGEPDAALGKGARLGVGAAAQRELPRCSNAP